jgi:hypothetical protein
MLMHHDAREYGQAASEAAQFARGKLTKLIDSGRSRAASVIEHVQAGQPEDRVAHGRALAFRYDAVSERLLVQVGNESRETFHRHALGQAAVRAGIPWSYVQHLQDQTIAGEAAATMPAFWARDLLARNLNDLYHHMDARFLLRSVRGEVRGFLSDRYRRLDSRPIVEAYATACDRIGAVPIEGYVTDTKMAIKALLPRISEPVPNEVLAYGVVLENSDFGNGALSLRMFILRLWCTNYAIGEETLRQVHLGTRLENDVVFSDRTYRLDTATQASKVRDLVRRNLSTDAIARFDDAVRKANDDQVDPRKVGERLRKVLSKEEIGRVVETFNSPDVQNLPPGNTTWRLSNAISWVAGKLPDAERKLELMRLAGSVIGGAA